MMRKVLAAILCGILVLGSFSGCSDGSQQTSTGIEVKKYIEHDDKYFLADALEVSACLNQYLDDDMKYDEQFEYSAKTNGLYTYNGKTKISIFTNPKTLKETEKIRFEYIYPDGKLSEEALPVIKQVFEASVKTFNTDSEDIISQLWKDLVPLEDVLLGSDYNVVVADHIQYIIADDYATDIDGKNIQDADGNKTRKALILVLIPTNKNNGIVIREQEKFYQAWLRS